MPNTNTQPDRFLSPGDAANQTDPLAGLVNVEAEQSLLGALLLNNAAFEYVADLVAPGDFVQPLHARMFEAIGERVGKGEKADPITLKNLFSAEPALRERGGGRYLVDLVASVVSIANAPDYARTIADLARRREIVVAAQDAIADAATVDGKRNANDVLDDTEQRFFQIAQGATKGGPEQIGQVSYRTILDTQAAYQSGGAQVLLTGLVDVDKIIGGMAGGELIVLGGRPGMGKSALAASIGFNLARQGKRVLYFSLEMTKAELTQRWLAGLSGVSTEQQRLGRLDQEAWLRLTEAYAVLRPLPLAIDDQGRLSVAAMRQRARRYRRRFGLDFLIVDHLQNIRQGGKVESRRLEIGDASSGLKTLAKELGIPILLLSQINRGVESRDDRRPTMGDLKESGDIEADADVVGLLYREEYYFERTRPRRRPGETQDALDSRTTDWEADCDRLRGIAEIIIAKNRHGGIGTANVAWNGTRQRFESLAR